MFSILVLLVLEFIFRLFSVCASPRWEGGIIKRAAVSVRPSVAYLDLTRDWKGLGSPKLVE